MGLMCLDAVVPHAFIIAFSLGGFFVDENTSPA